MHKHPLFLPIRYLTYISYMPNLMGISVSGMYLTISCEVDIVADFILAYMSKKVGAVCSF